MHDALFLLISLILFIFAAVFNIRENEFEIND